MNFQNIVLDLKNIGLTYREIGESCGLSVSAVSQVAYGQIKQPGGAAAIKLCDFHKRMMRVAEKSKSLS